MPNGVWRAFHFQIIRFQRRPKFLWIDAGLFSSPSISEWTNSHSNETAFKSWPLHSAVEMRCTFLPKCGRSTKIEIQIVILGDSFQENSETFWVFFKYWGEHLSGAGIGWKGNCRLCRHASISTPIWAPLPRKFLPLTRHLRWGSLFLTLLKHVWISLCVCAFRFLYLLSLIGFDDEKHMAFEPSMPHAKSNIWTVFYAWNPEVNKRPNNFYANKTTLFSVVHFFCTRKADTKSPFAGKNHFFSEC